MSFVSRKMNAAVLLAAMAFLPAACATEPPPPAVPNIGFLGKPIKLNVASITVDDRYNPPGTAPNVEQLHPLTPAGIAQRWADARLVAVGTRGIATLTITDGSVVAAQLPKKGGVEGFFGDPEDTKLTAKLSATLTVAVPADVSGGSANYSASVDASGFQTILESADLNDRDKAYYDLLQTIAKKFDAGLSAEVNRAMTPVIVP
jgi:hypothetical protein